MLIRRMHGSEFHYAHSETEDRRYIIALCGVLIEKESLEQQTVAEFPYSRCWTCRKLYYARLESTYNRKF